MSLLEKDKLMLQHRTTEFQRKADQEAEKRRNLESEGLLIFNQHHHLSSPLSSTSLLVFCNGVEHNLVVCC